MIIERLKLLRDKIASLPDEQVDLNIIGAELDCGSVGCLAGWAAILAGGRFQPSGFGGNRLLELARGWLRAYDQGSFFFSPYTKLTGREEALSRCDYAIANGGSFSIGDWLKTLPKELHDE